MIDTAASIQDRASITCKFKTLCDKKWGDLRTIAGEDRVRYCQDCEKPVFLCHTEEDLIAHAEASHCISLYNPSFSDLTGFVVV